MKIIAKSTILVFLLGFMLLANEAWPAMYMNLTGSWSEIVNSVPYAGNDFQNTYESATDQVTIDVLGTAGVSDQWQIVVKKSNVDWHNDLHFFVKRTSDGAGAGSISDGMADYVEINDINQYFFSGSGNRRDINIQLKLSGVSVRMPFGRYSIRILYSLFDI
jgi:hypothetical protein